MTPALQRPEPSLFSDARVVEAAARSMAERVSGMVARRGDEPVDVCRWHRDLADGILVAAVAALPREELIEKAARARYVREGGPDHDWTNGWGGEEWKGTWLRDAEHDLVAIGLIPDSPTDTTQKGAGAE